MIDWCDLTCEIAKWQTAFAGLVAFVGAYYTIKTMRRQIQQSYEHAEDARKRKARAARAAMPSALSSLVGYAEQCVVFAAQLRRLTDGRGASENIRTEFRYRTVPAIPQAALTILKECIEFSDDEPARRISEIFRDLQIQNSRLRGFFADIMGQGRFHLIQGADTAITVENVDRKIYDAALLYAKIGKLMKYARNEVETVPGHITKADVDETLSVLALDQTNFPTVFELVEREFPPS